MRSIGKVNIKKLNKIIEEEVKRPEIADVKDRIEARIPSEWYDIWESAWSEIERLIQGGIWKERNKRQW
jgi:hypothetical protein